ncbi:MAG: hypothetical protein NTW87_26585 [Planctomycetota bacterium]|nr:hypothetical protein [Planctomycetota bacterium]
MSGQQHRLGQDDDGERDQHGSQHAQKSAQVGRGRAAAILAVDPDRECNHSRRQQEDLPAVQRLVQTQAEIGIRPDLASINAEEPRQ